MRVLLTGMSGVGKSSLVQELRRRGHLAFDADDDGFSERAPTVAGGGGPRPSPSCSLESTAAMLFFAGCSEDQVELPFDYRVLLTAPEPVLVERLRDRTTNP